MKVTKPIYDINGFLLTSIHGKISRMYKDVSIGQPIKPPMLTVGIRDVKNSHNL